MASFARITAGQPADKITEQLRTVTLTEAHPCFAMVEQLSRQIPLQYIVVTGLEATGYGVGTGTFLLNSFPAGFLAEYYASSLAEVDPLVATWRDGVHMCSDADAFSHPVARRLGQRVRDLMDRYGIGGRTSVRIMRGQWTCGAITVAAEHVLTADQNAALQNMAYALHAQASSAVLAAYGEGIRLTRGELYCLQRAARGLTSEDIASEETYSVETVNTYLKSATRKLGAQNRTQAVAEALRLQLIN